ncbi:MAG: restriction endonuclease subunit R [Calditrichaeota bacterium]|nr:MAG: restriction endonuclease subunit R [Calditrichota bacterium]
MDQLKKFIEDVKSNEKIYEFDEAKTKQALILRLLSLLGWNIFDVEQVMPEHGVTSLRVDYSLRIFEQNKVFIEAKKVSEQLEKHQEQLLNYSFKEGVKLAILTNGITWWFYLPLNEGNWEQRRFYSIDIIEQDSSSAANKFIDFLEYDNIKTSHSLTQAEKLYKGRLKNKIIKENIPKAWNKIISEKDEFLIEIINDTVEKLCGIRANESDIINFIDTIEIDIKQSRNTDPIKSKQKKIKTNMQEKVTIPSQISKFPPNETLCRFSYKGQTYHGTIKNGFLQVESFGQYKSFSAASVAVSRTSRNGWLDWELKLPTSSRWVLADIWRKKI